MMAPSIAPQDAAGLVGLAAFLADKDLCLARMKALQDQEQLIRDLLSAQKETSEQAAKDLADAQQKIAEAEQIRQRNAIDRRELAMRETDLGKRLAVIIDANAALAEREDAINWQEASVAERERAVALKAQELAEALKSAEDAQAAFKAQRAKIIEAATLS